MVTDETRLCRILQVKVLELEKDIEDLHSWYRQRLVDREEEIERLTEALNRLRSMLQNMSIANTVIHDEL